MADAMIAATADKGVQVSFFNAPSLKDTSIPDMQNITNYDIMGRMLPFGGEVTVTGLLTGSDLLRELKGKNLGEELILC